MLVVERRKGSWYNLQPAVDCEVFAFLEVERSEGRVAQNKDFIQKAMEVAQRLQLQGFSAGCIVGRRGGM